MKPSGVVRKLRIKPGMTVLIRDAPSDFASLLSSMADGIKLLKASASRVDCVIAFVRCKADVQAVKSDLSRDSGWEPVFAGGFDSVAQISIDETWTGFRFRPKHLVGKRPR